MSRRATSLIIAAALLVPVFLSCSTDEDQGSEVKTQLGESGNRLVAKRYKEFNQAGRHCQAPTTGNKRVLVTGFGLFTGVEFNISGVVVSTFADEGMTSAEVSSVASMPSAMRSN